MQVLFLYNRQQETSKTADAYITRMDGLRNGLKDSGVPTDLLSLRTLRFHRPHLAFPLNAGAIASRAQGYDAIHAGGAAAALAAAAARSRHSHLVVFDVHGDEALETSLEWQAHRTLRNGLLVLQAMLLMPLALRAADLLVAVSEPFRERFLDKGVPADRIVIARNGVNAASYVPPISRKEGYINFCYAGGFQAWQAIDTLVDGFAQTQDKRLKLHLIGFSPRDQSLKNTIKARLAERVVVIDWLPRPALAERLHDADVLVIPRTTHRAMRGGLPSKFAEYLAVGRPLIVTNMDEAASFVSQHQCGLVCDPTAGGLAGAIEKAASWSEEERQAMGARSRRLSETVFDWRRIAKDYAAQLQNVIQSNGRLHG